MSGGEEESVGKVAAREAVGVDRPDGSDSSDNRPKRMYRTKRNPTDHEQAKPQQAKVDTMHTIRACTVRSSMTWAYAASRPSLASFAGPLVASPLRRSFATRRSDPHGTASQEDIKAARQWLDDLNPETIPRTMCDVSFSRSSGPGGQNVNKCAAKPFLSLGQSLTITFF